MRSFSLVTRFLQSVRLLCLVLAARAFVRESHAGLACACLALITALHNFTPSLFSFVPLLAQERCVLYARHLLLLRLTEQRAGHFSIATRCFCKRYRRLTSFLLPGGAGHAFRKSTAGAFGPDLAKKLSQLVKMEKNAMRSMELVSRERMEVAVSHHCQ